MQCVLGSLLNKCSVSHTLIYLWRPATISKLTATNWFFSKSFDFDCTFKKLNTVRMFYITVFLKETDCLLFNLACSLMSDKAAFVSRMMLCVISQRSAATNRVQVCGKHWNVFISFITFTFSRCFHPKRHTVHSGYTFFTSVCVPWESNPQPFTLLTQCSTTEPQEQVLHFI